MSHQQPFSYKGTSLPVLICLFDFILYIPSTIFQLCRDGLPWLNRTKLGLMYLAQGHNTVKPVRLEPAAPWSH